MKFVAIGRGDILFSSILKLQEIGHVLVGIVSGAGVAESRNQVMSYAELAVANKVPFVESNSNKVIASFLSVLGEFDIGISVNHKNILSADVLDQFTYGVLNLHGGDLPRFKGNACQAWAIIHGESQIAACVYRMEPSLLDTGKIISRRFLDLKEDSKIKDCLSWLETVGPDLFAESVKHLQTNSEFFVEDSSLSDVQGLRCHERRPEDGYIDWNRNAKEIVRLVNASSYPYFGAFSFLNGKLIKVLEAKLIDGIEPFLAIPGQVIQVGDGFAVVACGDKCVLVSEIDYGEGQVKASTVLKSTKIDWARKTQYFKFDARVIYLSMSRG